jgi:hypothetical protein
MSRLPSGLLSRLPESIPKAARDEVVGVVEQLAEDTSCLVTGSLVEGIGNAHSDVDFYIVQPAGAPARPVTIGIRGARYVDCEYLTVNAIMQLADRIADPSGTTLVGLNQRDFDRYYRLAIGIPLVVTAEVATALDRCTTVRACERFGQWSALQAYQHFARAAVSHALDRPRHAQLLLREAALWRASGALAEVGEGYPALKWTEVKAARRFGAGTAAYRDCLAGYLGPTDDVAVELDHARSRVVPPAAALSVMREHVWTMEDRVEVVDGNGVTYLLLGGRSIGWVGGVAGMVVAKLSVGEEWRKVVADLAATLAVTGDEVMAASFADLQALAAAGFLHSGRRSGKVAQWQ